MNIAFYIAGHFDKHRRTGGWSIAIREDKYESDQIISGHLDIGYNQEYCNAYPVLESLRQAYRIYFSGEYLHEESCHIIIHSNEPYVVQRIQREWMHRNRIKNFVRLNPWDKIRDNLMFPTSVKSNFLPSTHKTIDLLRSFAEQYSTQNSVTETTQ